jgi:hypothetical protein
MIITVCTLRRAFPCPFEFNFIFPAFIRIELTEIKVQIRSVTTNIPRHSPRRLNFNVYPSDFKMQDSELHILFQFKEKNAVE